jgi:hypothetical protein
MSSCRISQLRLGVRVRAVVGVAHRSGCLNSRRGWVFLRLTRGEDSSLFLFLQPVVVTINQEVDVTSLDGKRSPV